MIDRIQDRYGRTVAFVRVGDTLVNEKLGRQGLAWVFTRYCDRPICQEWKKLEEAAREARRGLWSMPHPVPPWEFRGRSRGECGHQILAPDPPQYVVDQQASKNLSER